MFIIKLFVAQMTKHVAPWEDDEGWTHSNCPNCYDFPNMLCELSRYLGYPQCPEYIAKVVTENEEQVYQVYIFFVTSPRQSPYFARDLPYSPGSLRGRCT